MFKREMSQGMAQADSPSVEGKTHLSHLPLLGGSAARMLNTGEHKQH